MVARLLVLFKIKNVLSEAAGVEQLALVYCDWLIFDMTHDCGHVVYVFHR